MDVSWTIKKTERGRIDAFEFGGCKTLQSPLDYKNINSDDPKEINPEYSLEGLLLKLKF